MYVIRNVECLECSYIWTAVFPYNIDVISNLKCPMCHNQNSMILKSADVIEIPEVSDLYYQRMVLFATDDTENNKFLF